MSTTQPIPPGEPAGSPVRGPAPRRSPAGVRAQFYGQPLTGRRAWAAEKLRVTAAKATAADAKKRAKAAPGDEPLPQPKISLMACDRRTLTADDVAALARPLGWHVTSEDGNRDIRLSRDAA